MGSFKEYLADMLRRPGDFCYTDREVIERHFREQDNPVLELIDWVDLFLQERLSE